MCIIVLIKVLMYEFHYYDYIENKYGNTSILFFSFSDSLSYKIKTKDFHEDFSKDKERFDLSNYSAESKYYDDSNKLIASKMENETGGVTIKEILDLKPKMYSFLIDDGNGHRKAKPVNENVVATISHGEWRIQ